MRELKFRVWSEDQKTYGYKFPYNSIGDFYVNTRGKVFSDFGNTVAPEVRQEAFIVEQYTGLKDKNGKEIYEGDIIKYAWTRCNYIVAYRKYDAGFVLENDNMEEIILFQYNQQNDYEVIGNIHENPKLLEEQ